MSHRPGSAADATLPSGQQPSTGGEVVSVMDTVVALRQTLTASIARGGEHSSADVDAYLDCEMTKLTADGY